MQESIGVIALVMVVAISLSVFAFTAYQNNYIASQQEYAQQLLAYKANQNANATFNQQSNQFELTMRSQGGLVTSILLNLGGTVTEAKYENCQFIGPLTVISVSGGTCTQNGVYVAVGQVLTVQVQGATPKALGFVTSFGNAYWAFDPFASPGGSSPLPPPPPPPSGGSGGGGSPPPSGGSGGSGGGSGGGGGSSGGGGSGGGSGGSGGGSGGSTSSTTGVCCYCWPWDRHGTCVASPFLSAPTMNLTEILSMILWFAVMALPLFKIRAGNYLNTEKNRKTCETPR